MQKPILIDFDYSKEMYSSNDDNDENTGDIGNPVFAAPEQINFNEYTYLVDSYSIRMIIHFINTKQKYNFNSFELFEIYAKKENISKTIYFQNYHMNMNLF